MKSPRNRRVGTLSKETAPILNGFMSSHNSPLTQKTQNFELEEHRLPGKQATRSQTRTAVNFNGNHLDASRAMNSLLSNPELQTPDGLEIDNIDNGFIDEPRQTGNLPAVISQAIARTDDTDIVPEWHQVKNLPGFAQQAVRNLGRMVFAEFTTKELSEIQTLSGLTNHENEVKAMMAWIQRNGVCEDKTEMDFSHIMPGITADVQLWKTEGFSFLLVRDDFSHYVYGWGGGRGVHLEQKPDTLRLR